MGKVYNSWGIREINYITSHTLYDIQCSVRSLVVRVVDLGSLAPHSPPAVRISAVSWIRSCEETVQLTYRTSMVLLRRPFVPEKNAPTGT